MTTMVESNAIYFGIPLKEEDGTPDYAVVTPSKSSHAAAIVPAPSEFKSRGGYGLLAFFIGGILASIGWVANQGWILASVALFGPYARTIDSAWKHILFSLVGSVCTSNAFWAVFKCIFSSELGDDEEEEEDEEETSPFDVPSLKRDMSDALRDLGELGFVAGYFLSQAFLTSRVYKPLVDVVVEYERSNYALTGATLAITMIWIFCSKMQDYHRAVRRFSRRPSPAHSFYEVEPTSKMTMIESKAVYYGIQEEDGVLTCAVASPSKPSHAAATAPTPSEFKSRGGYGLLAFFIGGILASIGWVANQGWILASVALFGPYAWTIDSAGKHILFALVGSVCTSIAFWAVFKCIFLSELENDDEEDEEETFPFDVPSLKRDMSDALRDLGELGFVVGYFTSQALLTSRMYKPLVNLGFEYERSNYALTGATLAIVMMWTFCSKMRDLKRAIQGANRAECALHINDSLV